MIPAASGDIYIHFYLHRLQVGSAKLNQTCTSDSTLMVIRAKTGLRYRPDLFYKRCPDFGAELGQVRPTGAG